MLVSRMHTTSFPEARHFLCRKPTQPPAERAAEGWLRWGTPHSLGRRFGGLCPQEHQGLPKLHSESNRINASRSRMRRPGAHTLARPGRAGRARCRPVASGARRPGGPRSPCTRRTAPTGPGRCARRGVRPLRRCATPVRLVSESLPHIIAKAGMGPAAREN